MICLNKTRNIKIRTTEKLHITIRMRAGIFGMHKERSLGEYNTVKAHQTHEKQRETSFVQKDQRTSTKKNKES